MARALAWDGLLNARDTGGLPTADGRTVRHGALIRSDVLTRLTPAGRAALVGHGVRTIVDVRSPSELERDLEPHPFRAAGATTQPQVTYLNVPFTDERAWARIHAAYGSAESREELNRLDLDLNQLGITAIAAAVADAQPGGVLVHCHAGKDRTGLIVALLLSLVGVSDEEIASDYALTALRLDALIADWLDESAPHDQAERRRLRRLAEPRREAMLDTLAYLRQEHGSAEEYLRAGGLSDEQVARLRERLT